ncbi:MAG TPA: hypothetical protein VF288_11545 [Mycobacteriales bacterium]
MSTVAVWIVRIQALALVGLAVAAVVLAATSTTSLGAGFVISEVVAALAVAALIGLPTRHRRLRAPILLLELIAVGIAGQLASDHRPLIAVAVGVPALVAALAILLGERART